MCALSKKKFVLCAAPGILSTAWSRCPLLAQDGLNELRRDLLSEKQRLWDHHNLLQTQDSVIRQELADHTRKLRLVA
jgi:hypothetical protein